MLIKPYGKISKLNIDIQKLQNTYREIISQEPSVPYTEGTTDYDGWAITNEDGVATHGVGKLEKGEQKVHANKKTKLCTGNIENIVDQVTTLGLRPERVRIVRLKNKNFLMPIHTDFFQRKGKSKFRLHIPIITNRYAYFEWWLEVNLIFWKKLHIRKHFPADGSVWWVRVDIPHRAINLTKEGHERVHLIMDIDKP